LGPLCDAAITLNKPRKNAKKKKKVSKFHRRIKAIIHNASRDKRDTPEKKKASFNFRSQARRLTSHNKKREKGQGRTVKEKKGKIRDLSGFFK